MKPLRIQIKNLGAIPSADIDLTGITCAAICGANGLGKSTAFTTAPRFALFGNLKPGTRVDDMVRTGTSEMFVIYDFEHQGGVWRVIRTRSTKGKGKSTLELQRQSGELWASESGASIDETQKKIIDLLNLTDETFVASSMILQGDASNFTARPAGQRKAILAQILQLDQYDGLQDKAKAKVSVTNISLERDKAMLASMDERLAERPQLQADLEAVRAHLKTNESVESSLDHTLSTLRESLTALLKQDEDAKRYKKQAEELRDDADQKKLVRSDQQDRLAIAESYLLQEPDILAKAAEHDRIWEKVTLLQGKVDQRNTLAIDGEQASLEIEQIEESLKKVYMDIAFYEQQLAKRPKLEEAVMNLDAARNNWTAQQLAKEQDNEQCQKADKVMTLICSKVESMGTGNVAKLNEIKIYTDRAAMLKDSKCIDITRAECAFLADAKKAKAKADELQAAYDVWHSDALAAIELERGRYDEIMRQRAEISYDEKTYDDAKNLYDDLTAQEVLLKSLDGEAKLLENLQAQRVDMETRQTGLETKRQALREEYRNLNDELAELPAHTQQLSELAPYLKKRELLPAIHEKQKAAAEQIKSLTAEIDALTEKGNQAFALYVETVPEDGQIQSTTDELNDYQAQLEAIRKSKSSVTMRIGALTAKLEALDKDDSARAEILQHIDPLAKELTRWQTLVKAFGRDGIPALIIENTVPELERIANEILGQMSGGKHNLRFETQRELKSKAGMAETLDIIVGDWAGERIYETFSGGEQLRIDFAIRFALAELLARRAGARVDWLTIDEGFGSQSDEYLPLVIEAVKSVANRFGMVLVISHVKQVQEAFEQTIVFRPDGEQVEVKVA